MGSVNLTFNESFSCKGLVEFKLTGSKSISQRVLIINYLKKSNFKIRNLSNSEDTMVLLKALTSTENTVNLKQSGSAMRFLIALFAYEQRDMILEGDESLLKRPIANLINSLNMLGGNIVKKNNRILIKGTGSLIGQQVSFHNTPTSQFVSSLLLISPYIKNGIDIIFDPSIYSKSYIDMTTSLMKSCGAKLKINHNQIRVFESIYTKSIDFIESDWTSASYLFLAFLFSQFQKIKIKFLDRHSVQGDSVIVDFFSLFGVLSTFDDNVLLLVKQEVYQKPKKIEWNFSDHPDLFPSILVACFGSRVELLAHGLSTLIHKESNRILSMKNELLKFNGLLEIKTKDSVYLKRSDKVLQGKSISIDPHKDHRVALSLAPLSLLGFCLTIKNSKVINKSYPNFFNDLTKFGVLIDK
jgi:3-phosphoshikimate 1-carboxyvinyltransferase